MQARYQRILQDGKEYDKYFPTAEGKNNTMLKSADVDDTLALIPKVVRSTLHHTAQLAPLLKGNTLDETCENIWDFVYQHIAYRKDADGKEQVRSPARTWRDRKQGVDCDCYTTFISSLLTNLKIPHTYRITKYFKPYYQHIYPIVPLKNGKHLTLDCVVEKYNYEEPYSAKKDTPMELQYLNGLDGELASTHANTVDMQDLLGYDDELSLCDIDDLGDLGRRRKKANSYEPKSRSKVGKFFQKVAHVANKANPATVLLRNGVLASMKLNLFKTAQRLKWSYLSDAEAQKRGIDMQKFEKLKKVRAKLETIFFGSGGNPENLKRAVLKGKGNRGNEVSGLGEVMYMDEDTPLEQLLGDMFEEFSGLGEPATGAAIATATAVITAIAGLLKGVGNIFPNKQEGTSDFENTESGDSNSTSATSLDENKTVPPSIDSEGKANSESNVSPQSNSEGSSMMRVANAKSETENGGGDEGGDGFWDKNKKWLKPTLIGAGSVGVLYMGYRMMSGNKNKAPTRSPSSKQGLNGTRKKKRKPPQTKKKITRKSLF